jgi:pimeloyl-ACP methyl ester carboxylesterase
MDGTDVRRMRVARPDGAELVAEAIGDWAHPLVVLIGGAGCSMDWWRPEFCRELAASGLRVLRFDQRGTGETILGPPGRRRDGLSTAVDDVIGLLDAAGADDAHLVGFSSGGWVAQLAALDHPDRVRALTLISTSPTMFEADPDLPGATARMQEAWAKVQPEPDWDDPDAVVEYHVDIDRDYAGDEFDEAHDRAIWTDTVRRSPGMHRDEGGADVIDHAPRWRERLGEIRVPTTVLHGTADPVFPMGNAEALVRDIPGARLVTIPGGGHELPPAAWGAVVDAVAGSL